jgi:hypothetical protein
VLDAAGQTTYNEVPMMTWPIDSKSPDYVTPEHYNAQDFASDAEIQSMIDNKAVERKDRSVLYAGVVVVLGFLGLAALALVLIYGGKAIGGDATAAAVIVSTVTTTLAHTAAGQVATTLFFAPPGGM